ncbi:MAG TPA: S-layer homology domain-containing protein, partial [Clostridiaceae bacterium]|nr:S-layer homology domain-containing protein [Clostridiaceae bacterium]
TISDTTVTLTANENASITTTLNIAVNKTDSGGGSGGKSGGSGGSGSSGGSTPTPPTPPPAITVTEVQSELFTNTEDIIVEADVTAAFGQPVEVKITDEEESQNEIFQLTGADDEVHPFDISLYSRTSGEKVQPKEGYSVKITLPIPEKLLVVRDQVKVVYVRDGKLEVLSSQVVEKDGKWYITFEAVHFSPYALIVNKEPADTWTNPFSDVKEGSWYYSAVQYVAQNGLMFGTGSDTFSPQLTTNRGMIATILYRLSGSPETLESTFKDVVPGAYYTQGVAWAQEKGIIAGYGNGMFGPEDSITREQMAAILWRYAGSPKADTTVLNDFNDAGEISDYARQAMAWVYEEGIIAGKGNRILDPRGLATRAEAAMILTNYLKAK